jgi:hypothetical protein
MTFCTLLTYLGSGFNFNSFQIEHYKYRYFALHRTFDYISGNISWMSGKR